MTTTGLHRLEQAWAKGRQFLGSPFAILGGAMSWVSERNLVAAISNGGGFGVLACGSMSPALLDAEIKATQALTAKPFGVNLITMHPDLDQLIEVCGANKVSHVVLAGGLPSGPSIARAKELGAKVICFAPALIIAKKLVRSGADALVIEGAEAGGHIGPVATSVLAQEILPEMAGQVPVFVAGGIGRGEAIVSYLDMGAAGVQLGPCQFQKGVLAGGGAGCAAHHPDRSGLPGDSGAGFGQQGQPAFRGISGRGDRPLAQWRNGTKGRPVGNRTLLGRGFAPGGY